MSANVEAVALVRIAELEGGIIKRDKRIAELKDALYVAERTYAALERNYEYLCLALQAKGLPTSWLGTEIAKAEKIRTALKQT